MSNLGEFQIRTAGAGGWELWHKTAGYLRSLTWVEVQNVIRRQYDPAALLRGDLILAAEVEAGLPSEPEQEV